MEIIAVLEAVGSDDCRVCMTFQPVVAGKRPNCRARSPEQQRYESGKTVGNSSQRLRAGASRRQRFAKIVADRQLSGCAATGGMWRFKCFVDLSDGLCCGLVIDHANPQGVRRTRQERLQAAVPAFLNIARRRGAMGHGVLYPFCMVVCKCARLLSAIDALLRCGV